MKKTHEQFIDDMKVKNPNIIILGKYENTKTRVKCKCNICGHEWEPMAGDLLSGRGCPICKRKILSQKNSKTHEQFVEQVKDINPNIRVIGKYVKAHKKVECKCVICGNEWSSEANSILYGTGCPECAKRKKGKSVLKTNEKFLSDLKEANPNIKVHGNYVNSKTHIKCECKICGHIWDSMPTNLLRKYGCPRCNHSSTSYGEQFMYLLLRATTSYNVLSRTKKPIGRELDIYIEELKIAIEYGAFYWHKKRQIEDNNKRELCEKAGIKLITIYDGLKNTETNDILIKDAILYKDQMSDDDYVNVIKKILNDNSLDFKLTQSEIMVISQKAYSLSKMRNTEDFIEELHEINPEINVLGEYKSVKKPIKCECKICGNIWNPTPDNLLQGFGCRKCSARKNADRQRKTHEQFIEQLKKINPSIKVLGKYKTNNTKVLCECLVCQFQWEATPSNLLNGKGCGKCKGVKISQIKRKTHKQFVEELKLKNPTIEVLGEYEAGNIDIECKCLICGAEWKNKPTYLLCGTGCPDCLREKRRNNFLKKW